MPSVMSSPSTFAETFCIRRKAAAWSSPRSREISSDHSILLSENSTPRRTSSMNSRPSCSTSVSGLRLSTARSPITSLRCRAMLCAAPSGM